MKPLFLAAALVSASTITRADGVLQIAGVEQANVSPAASLQQSGGADVELSAARKVESGSSLARFASGKGTILFVGAGTLLPLLEDDGQNTQHSLRVADSVLTSFVAAEAIKAITHEKRPDGSDFKSFPSGHATAAFAVAAMQAHFHPKQAIFWYLGATGIAYSRVKLRRHFLKDVVAGAALGYFTTRVELNQKHGLLLFPFVRAEKQNANPSAGLRFVKSF